MHQKLGVMTVADDDIPSFGAALRLPVQPRHQLCNVMSEQLLPGEHRLLGGGVAPHDLAVFPHDQGRHGEIEDGIAHDMLNGILKLCEAAAVITGDDCHPDDAAGRQHEPCAGADIECGDIIADKNGGKQTARRDENRKNRTILIETFLHDIPPFRS